MPGKSKVLVQFNMLVIGDESPQADPSLAPKSTPKKRGRPTETTTIAKKLFKDSTQKKPTDSE